MSSAEANKQASAHLLINDEFLEDAKTPVYSVWQIEYYQKFFNVKLFLFRARVKVKFMIFELI